MNKEIDFQHLLQILSQKPIQHDFHSEPQFYEIDDQKSKYFRIQIKSGKAHVKTVSEKPSEENKIDFNQRATVVDHKFIEGSEINEKYKSKMILIMNQFKENIARVYNSLAINMTLSFGLLEVEEENSDNKPEKDKKSNKISPRDKKESNGEDKDNNSEKNADSVMNKNENNVNNINNDKSNSDNNNDEIEQSNQNDTSNECNENNKDNNDNNGNSNKSVNDCNPKEFPEENNNDNANDNDSKKSSTLLYLLPGSKSSVTLNDECANEDFLSKFQDFYMNEIFQPIIKKTCCSGLPDCGPADYYVPRAQFILFKAIQKFPDTNRALLRKLINKRTFDDDVTLVACITCIHQFTSALQTSIKAKEIVPPLKVVRPKFTFQALVPTELHAKKKLPVGLCPKMNEAYSFASNIDKSPYKEKVPKKDRPTNGSYPVIQNISCENQETVTRLYCNKTYKNNQNVTKSLPSKHSSSVLSQRNSKNKNDNDNNNKIDGNDKSDNNDNNEEIVINDNNDKKSEIVANDDNDTKGNNTKSTTSRSYYMPIFSINTKQRAINTSLVQQRSSLDKYKAKKKFLPEVPDYQKKTETFSETKVGGLYGPSSVVINKLIRKKKDRKKYEEKPKSDMNFDFNRMSKV